MLPSIDPKLSIGDYIIESFINSGSYAQVYKAKHVPTGCYVSLKIISKLDMNNPDKKSHFENEVQILSKIKHPYIVELFDVIETEEFHAMVFEYVDGGDLLSYVNKNSYSVDENEVKRLFAQLISALYYLHFEMHIIHCDLKLENILIDQYRNIRLIDFGFAHELNSSISEINEVCGSLSYMAPEVISQQKYGTNVDVWSAGVVLYTLMVHRLPFDGDFIKQQKKILSSPVKIPPLFPPLLTDLISKMLDKNPITRLPLNYIITHRWNCDYYNDCNYIVQSFMDYYKKPDTDVIKSLQQIGISTNGLLSSLIKKDHSIDSYVSYCIMRRKKACDLIIAKKSNPIFISKLCHKTVIKYNSNKNNVLHPKKNFNLPIPKKKCNNNGIENLGSIENQMKLKRFPAFVHHDRTSKTSRPTNSKFPPIRYNIY